MFLGFPKGPRTQIIGFQGPNPIIFMVSGQNATLGVLGPLGSSGTTSICKVGRGVRVLAFKALQ